MAKKNGFTLAEVLITLGIIGVVAAMTIPNLITSHQKKVTVTKLQKAISIMNQAYRLAYDDVGEATAEEAMAMGSDAYFEKYWAPYVKTAHICTTKEECGYDGIFTYANGKKMNSSLFWKNHRTSFYTSDGMLYTIAVSGGTVVTAANTIWVDINGATPPNTVGKDVFVLERLEDGEKGGAVAPYGHSLNQTKKAIDKNCSKTGVGDFCALKIKDAGWKIDDSYPW